MCPALLCTLALALLCSSNLTCCALHSKTVSPSVLCLAQQLLLAQVVQAQD